MHTQQLTVNQQPPSTDLERSGEAAIWAEIAARLLELKQVSSAHRASAMLSKLHALSMIHPEALWLVVALLTGDLSEITKSYSEMGKEQGKSKQGVEQSRSRAIAGIQQHFPQLATAIIELRHITSQIGPQIEVKISKEL